MTRLRHKLTVTTCSMAVMALLVFATSNASALDKYKSRKGLFAGVGVGGGTGAAEVDPDNQRTGIDDGRVMGLHLQASVGGGANELLTVAAEGNWWIRTVELGDRHLDHQHLSFLAMGRFFFLGGLYAGAGGGLAYAIFDTEENGVSEVHYREMGVAVKATAGYEFFLNGNVAAGIEASYARHFYSNADFDTLNGGITLRWY